MGCIAGHGALLWFPARHAGTQTWGQDSLHRGCARALAGLYVINMGRLFISLVWRAVFAKSKDGRQTVYLY